MFTQARETCPGFKRVNNPPSLVHAPSDEADFADEVAKVERLDPKPGKPYVFGATWAVIEPALHLCSSPKRSYFHGRNGFSSAIVFYIMFYNEGVKIR